MDPLEIILSTMKDNKQDSIDRNAELKKEFDGMREAVNRIDKSIVGQIRCAQIMEDYEHRVQDGNEILRKEMADNHKTIIDELVPIKAYIQCGQDQRRLVDLTWKMVTGNSVLRTLVTGGILALVGIYWGRAMELASYYGIHIVLIGIFIIIIASISAYVSRHKAGKVASVIKKYLFWI
jgi:hypothetical protein